MQKQTDKMKTLMCTRESDAMAKAVAYYEWCVANGRTAVSSSTDDEEHRHYVWVSRYKAAVRGSDYRYAWYPSVTRYLTDKFGKREHYECGSIGMRSRLYTGKEGW